METEWDDEKSAKVKAERGASFEELAVAAMIAKKLKLTAEERRIEKEVVRGEWKPASAKRKALFRAGLHKKVAAIQRGGHRPGAGRKAKSPGLLRVQLSCKVAPLTLRKLQKKAQTVPISLGTLVDRLVESGL